MVSFPYNDVRVTINEYEMWISVDLVDNDNFSNEIYFEGFTDSLDLSEAKSEIVQDLKKKQIKFTLTVEA